MPLFSFSPLSIDAQFERIPGFPTKDRRGSYQRGAARPRNKFRERRRQSAFLRKTWKVFFPRKFLTMPSVSLKVRCSTEQACVLQVLCNRAPSSQEELWGHSRGGIYLGNSVKYPPQCHSFRIGPLPQETHPQEIRVYGSSSQGCHARQVCFGFRQLILLPLAKLATPSVSRNRNRKPNRHILCHHAPMLVRTCARRAE